MPATTNREIRLAQRPHGLPDGSTFELVEGPLPEPGAGEVLVRNIYMSVDPAMRGRMNDVRSYAPPFELGATLQGGAIGRVVASNYSSVAMGDLVQSGLGWREYFAAPAASLTRIEQGDVPLTHHLGVLGGTGFTAYIGMFDIGQPKRGETVFVSAAAGAVGSVAGQIAKLEGCRVIGSAGSDEKCDWLTRDLGFDAAFNYKKTTPDEALTEHAPDGIDVYFDNVGGEISEAVVPRMNVGGRISVCGQISQYNLSAPEMGPRQTWHFIVKRLTMRGFLVFDFAERYDEALRQLAGWIDAGQLSYREDIVAGLENAPAAFIGMLTGDNIGKRLIHLG